MSLPKPYYEDGSVTIYHGDCLDLMPHLEADVLVTDPPYGIGDRWNKAWVAKSGRSRLTGQGDDWDDLPADTGLLARAAQNREAIIWGGNYYGLIGSRGWLVWDKCQSFSGAEAELAWTNLDMPVRVFRLSRGAAHSLEYKQHPTQKPIRLMRWAIEFTKGTIVFDPFMGSGTTLRAAKDLGRKAIGIEISEEYCSVAAERLAQDVLPFIAEPDAADPSAETSGGDHVPLWS